MLLRKFLRRFWRKLQKKFLMPGFPRYSGKPLGDEPSKEETLAAWEAFEQKHISSEKEHLSFEPKIRNYHPIHD